MWFYAWGEVLSFTDVDEAVSYCLNRDIGIAVLVIDVFLGVKTGFYFLDAIEKAFPSAHEDAIMITGYASGDVVNTCVASGINHLLEKPDCVAISRRCSKGRAAHAFLRSRDRLC